MNRSSKHRAPFVETLESRQFLSASAATCDIADPAPVDPKAIVVAKPAKADAAPGKAIWNEAKAGVKLKFKKTKTFPGHGLLGSVWEGGTFTDEKGGTGTYELVLPTTKFSSVQPPQILNLTFKTAKIQRSLTIQFTPASKRLNAGLNNKTVTFVKTAAGTAAKVVQSANVGAKVIYMKY